MKQEQTTSCYIFACCIVLTPGPPLFAGFIGCGTEPISSVAIPVSNYFG